MEITDTGQVRILHKSSGAEGLCSNLKVFVKIVSVKALVEVISPALKSRKNSSGKLRNT
ncbi:MAG: hypothetical protein HY913_09160 [Desulfomonile tiedjei]|nr:hypothetical protein [Desulfomonile tiedjei]